MKTLQMTDPLPLRLGAKHEPPKPAVVVEPVSDEVRWVLDPEGRQSMGDLAAFSGIDPDEDDDDEPDEDAFVVVERRVGATVSEILAMARKVIHTDAAPLNNPQGYKTKFVALLPWCSCDACVEKHRNLLQRLASFW